MEKIDNVKLNKDKRDTNVVKGDNKKNIVLMFPGQGSQYLKMGFDFLNLDKDLGFKKYLDIASEKTKFDILQIISNENGDGLGNNLGQTFFSQVSILSLSCFLSDYLLKFLGLNKNNILCSLGHSLGDYSALYSCGYFSFEDVLDIVIYRAKLMSKANETLEGAMAAIIGIDSDELANIINEFNDLDNKYHKVFIANYNDYTQSVITGKKVDVEKFLDFLKSKSNAKAIPLKVNTASHCPLMQQVSVKMGEYLERITLKEPIVKFYSSSQLIFPSTSMIKDVLKNQLISPINWVKSIEFLLTSNSEIFIEVGPGKVLSGLVKKIAAKNGKKVEIFNTDNLLEIENIKKFFNFQNKDKGFKRKFSQKYLKC